MKTINSFVFSIIFIFSMTFLDAQESITLKFNPDLNKTYRIKTLSNMTLTQTIQGNQYNIDISTNASCSFKLMEKKDNYSILEFHFDTTIIKTSTIGMNFEINSTKPGNIKSEKNDEVMAAFINRYCSNPLFIKIDNNGKILQIINIKLFSDIVLQDIDSIKLKGAEQIKAQIKNLVDENQIKYSIESLFDFYPEKPIKINENWTKSTKNVTNGLSFSVNSTFKIAKIVDNIAEVNVESSLEPADSGPIEISGNKITNNIKGLNKGTVKIRLTDGILLENFSKNHMEGDMSVNNPGINMTIPIIITGESKSLLIE